MNRKTVNVAVFGTEHAASLVSALVAERIPFSFMPLPDDGYQVDAPEEYEKILTKRADALVPAAYGPMTLKYDVDGDGIFVSAGTVLTPIHFKDDEYLCSHFDMLIWISIADFDVMPISTTLN